MAIVVGVRFKKPGKVYYFDPGPHAESIAAGDTLVVETVRGLELGECAGSAAEVADEQIIPPLRKVARVATDKDIRQVQKNRESERDAYGICQEKIAAHKIEMKLVDVEFAFDGSKILFYFTANGRVDFRSLVKDLAAVFKTRIELRQIGVRDEAKMLGGLGPCGRPICCGTFLGDFQPVSIKMAKEQNLSLNPTKISGLCGRLMCCLKYEQENYEEARKTMPRVGKDVITPDGRGHVIDINVLKQTAKVRVPVGDTNEVREYNAADLERVSAADQERRPPVPGAAVKPPRPRRDRPEGGTGEMATAAEPQHAERRAERAHPAERPARSERPAPRRERPRRPRGDRQAPPPHQEAAGDGAKPSGLPHQDAPPAGPRAPEQAPPAMPPVPRGDPAPAEAPRVPLPGSGVDAASAPVGESPAAPPSPAAEA